MVARRSVRQVKITHAITLTQPWALLLASGAKRVETRGWAPAASFRGWVAIHASKSWTAADRAKLLEEPFRSAILEAGVRSEDAMPLGVILGVAELVKVAPIKPELVARLSEREVAFGGYGPNRHAFAFRGARRLAVPIEARGRLNFWPLDHATARALEDGLRGEAGPGEILCPICGQRAQDGGHAGEACPNETAAAEASREAAAAREEAELEELAERAAIVGEGAAIGASDAGFSVEEARARASVRGAGP